MEILLYKYISVRFRFFFCGQSRMVKKEEVLGCDFQIELLLRFILIY